MYEEIEEQYGCKVSPWSMNLVNYDRFVDGKLISVPCNESVGNYFEGRLIDQYVEEKDNNIADADFTMDGDQGWLALVVEGDNEEDVRRAASILHNVVDRPVNWRDT